MNDLCAYFYTLPFMQIIFPQMQNGHEQVIHLHLDFAYSLFKNVNSQCLVSTHTVVLHQSFETHNKIQAFDMCFNGL